MLFTSYATAWCLVAVETVVLLELVRRVVRLKTEMYEAMPSVARQERLAKGTFVDFAARDLASGDLVRSSDLRGAPATLLFIGAGGVEAEPSEWMLGTAAGLLDKGEGRLLVLCDGGADDCAALSRGLAPLRLPVLLDEGGEIRRRFLVRSTPAAVLLDGQASVDMYGRPDESTDSDGRST